MRVDRLVLKNYRNYGEMKTEFHTKVNIFTGANAQGKTNILEAVYLAATGRSHRTFEDNELIQWKQQAAIVDIFFKRQDIEHILTFKFIKDQNKQILLDGNTIKNKDIIGLLNVVLFSPEDLSLVKGAPQLRRRFLDMEISQASPVYYRQLLQYNRIVSQRNNLLKKIRERLADPLLIDAWDEQLAKAAAVLVAKRLEAVKKFNMLANLMHRRLTGNKENLSVQYEINGAGEDISTELQSFYQVFLKENRQADIYRGSTGVGPHRDDLVLLVNGESLRNYGSQGQQRTGVLSLKLAELEFIKSETGEYPVLLLDDVMSELDGSRREHLLSFIKDRIQTFITATDSTFFPEMNTARLFRIAGGQIME